LRQGRRHEPYEEAIRDVLLTSQRGTFSFEDITGMSWIEIDFSADVERARSEILPRILRAKDNRKVALPVLQGIDKLKPQVQ
jgi:choline kinase